MQQVSFWDKTYCIKQEKGLKNKKMTEQKLQFVDLKTLYKMFKFTSDEKKALEKLTGVIKTPLPEYKVSKELAHWWQENKDK